MLGSAEEVLSEAGLIDAVRCAYRAASSAGDASIEGRQARNKARSTRFVEQLAQQLEVRLARAPGALGRHVAVLRRSKGNPHFARSELLFDILACEYELVGGPVHTGSQIPRVVRPLVQVESELAQNTRDSVTDFNKLVCGSAAWSLFVGPLNASNGSISYLDMLAPLADRVTGRVCIAFIPHPEEWPSTAGALGFAWDRGPRGWRVVG